jgi:5'-deoxynucleotidase
MPHPFFAYIARMRCIGRWGLMRNTYQENIQEHSHMVAVLAHALAVIRREEFGGTIDPGHVAAVALYHDAPEIFTGDLPTPVKYANPTIQAAYKAVEEGAAQRLAEMLPESLRPAFSTVLAETDPEVLALVKAADKLSAHIKCLEELKAGNREFQSAAQQTLAALESYHLPELDYFMKHFLPSFSLTLDELESDT